MTHSPLSAPNAPRRSTQARLPLVRTNGKMARDTVLGCRERARADLAEAASITNENRRGRLEHSASTWSDRADLLQRLSDSFDARQAIVVAARQSSRA